MTKLTFNEYDEIEEKCDRLMASLSTDEIDLRNLLNLFPTVEELEKIDIKKNLQKYMPFMLFWYSQEADERLLDDKEEYKKTKAYIKKLIEQNLELVDEEDM